MAPAPVPPRRLVYVPLDELPPDPDNEKLHAGERIRASIETLGFIEPTILDERTGLLISGHGRREQLMELEAAGADVPEGIMVGDDGRWLAPRIDGWRSIDDDHAATARVTLNHLPALGGFVPDALAATLARLDQSDTPGLLYVTGHDQGDLSDLLASFSDPPSLDDLRDQHGESRPEDFWPSLRFTIPAELKARYEQLVAACGEEANDVARFTFLVERAELACEPSVELFVGGDE